MSTNPQDSELRERVVRYAEVLNAPVFNMSAVRRRAVSVANRHAVPRPFKWQLVAGMVIVVALLAVEPGIPAIVSGVSRAFPAFVVTNGRLQRATTRTVTLQQAQSDMPFRVIVPSQLPPTMHTTISEVYPSSSGNANAQLWFRYSGREPGMELTILETSPSSPYAPPASGAARGSSRTGTGEVIVSQSQNGMRTMVTGGAMITGVPPTTCLSMSMVHDEHAPRVSTSCKPPKPPGGRGAAGFAVTGCRRLRANGGVQVTCSGGTGPSTTRVMKNGLVTRAAMKEPMRWVSHGTLIIVFDPAGVLSEKQIQALRAGMSR